MNAINTYSLDEVAAMVLPPDLKQPRVWLMRRLRTGQIRGYRVGRTWRMTEDQVRDMVDRLTNTVCTPENSPGPPAEEPISSVAAGLSARSRRRLLDQPR